MQSRIIESFQEVFALDFTPSILIVFYEAGQEEDLSKNFALLSERFPKCDMIGCSSEGNIYNQLPYLSNGNHPLNIVAFDLDKKTYAIQVIDTSLEPIDEYGAEVTDQNEYHVLFFSTISQDQETYLKALHNKFGSDTVFGALAGGHNISHIGHESIFYNGTFTHSSSLIWLLDKKHYNLTSSAMHMFEPMGFEMTITEASEYTIHEIEKRPALNLIESIIGPFTEVGIQRYDYPFFITDGSTNPNQKQSLSTLRSINELEQSLSFFKHVQNGQKLRIGVPASRSQLENDLKSLAEKIPDKGFTFLFFCVALKSHWKETEPLYLMYLAKKMHKAFMGFHAYGEISTLVPDQPTQLQNQTITFVSLSAKESV